MGLVAAGGKREPPPEKDIPLAIPISALPLVAGVTAGASAASALPRDEPDVIGLQEEAADVERLERMVEQLAKEKSGLLERKRRLESEVQILVGLSNDMRIDKM